MKSFQNSNNKNHLNFHPSCDKKSLQIKDIHKTLESQKRNSHLDIYTSKNDLTAYLKTNKKPRQRSKSQLNGYNQYSSQNQNKSKSLEIPINIFISIQKLNKMKINNTQEKKERTIRSILRNMSRKKSNVQLQQQVLDIQKLNKIRNKSSIYNIDFSKQQQLKNRNYTKRRFKTLEDEDLTTYPKKNKDYLNYKHPSIKEQIREQSLHNKKMPKDKQQNKVEEVPPQLEKLKYEELKYDFQRFPRGFKKYKLLGRGGFSLVWLGYHTQSKTSYAVKQILTKNKYQTHLKQIWLCNYFFSNGRPRQQFQTHPGVRNLLTMYDYQIEQVDTWIIYQLCDGSLGSMLYELFKQEGNQEQKFVIKYKSMYLKMRENPRILKGLIIQVAKVLDLLMRHNIVHSDLKTQNILIQQIKNQENHSDTSYAYKLIDYGSSFAFTNMKQYTLATPEYMCPELLNFVLYQNKRQYNKEMLQALKNYNNVSAIDVWGLGCVILEIINGIPLWLNNPTKIFHKGAYVQRLGLFSVKNRNFKDIIQKQLNLLNNIDDFFKTMNFSGIYLDDQLKYIVKRMLDLNPATRIKPDEILTQLGAKLSYKKYSLIEDLQD